jgi:hypothetical protein
VLLPLQQPDRPVLGKQQRPDRTCFERIDFVSGLRPEAGA